MAIAVELDKYPTIARLLKAGTIWVEGVEFVGRAADGVVVSLGTVITLESTEKFLDGAPNPADW